MQTSTAARLAVVATLASATRAQTQSQSVSVLIDAIKNPDANVRGPAGQAAGPFGAPAVKPLAALIPDADFETARAAKRALWKIVRYAGRPGAASERGSCVKELLALLNDKARPVRREALWMLSEIGDAEVVQPVSNLLSDPDTQEDARAALQRIPGDESIQALQAALLTLPEPYRPAIAVSLRARGVNVSGYPSRKLVPTRPAPGAAAPSA